MAVRAFGVRCCCPSLGYPPKLALTARWWLLLAFLPPLRSQNPDPATAEYFASHVSKAYAALTDEVSRGNYEKFGHPDGPQVWARGGQGGIVCSAWGKRGS